MPNKYPDIITNPDDWPINVFGKGRKGFIEELNGFTLQRILDKHGSDLRSLLDKTLYMERQRVKTMPWKVDPVDDKAYWTSLTKEVKEASKHPDAEDRYMALLKRVINRYSTEIVGHFNPKTFRFARKFLTMFYKLLLSSVFVKKSFKLWGSRDQLLDRLEVHGHIEETRNLFEKGTVVVVPTHFSNLDSIMIGYIVDGLTGIPPFSFGAGLNLYDAELVGYFMNRLGAYRVDRRKKNPVYLESLKAMTTQSLQKGVNNIFFPGGTRSRDGSMEGKLKLGLLGSAVEAQRIEIQKGSQQKVFVVPVIIGYHYVLEGQALIEQHLRLDGKERYVRSRSTMSGYKRVAKFVRSILRKKGQVVLSFGEPMDVFGNSVDSEGLSRDKYGNEIELKDYFVLDGHVSGNSQRESVYTRILGERIVKSYMRNNVVMSSHLVAFLGWQCLVKYYQTADVYDLLRMPQEEFFVEQSYFRSVMEQAQRVLLDWEKAGKVRLSDAIQQEPEHIIKDGLYYLGQYHPRRPLKRDKKGDIVSQNFKLLYFYHNRTVGYDLQQYIEWPEIQRSATAEHINI